MMGNLSQDRLNPNSPFNTCIDYAGPVLIKDRKIRGYKVLKSYICVYYICFATKTVHIDLANDMCTEAFLAAFRRFVARRCVRHSLVGARSEIKQLNDFLSCNSNT